ncbi:MAG: ABC transporter permease [Clostridiaceae bacterium]|nr:ABC transporter permease [Clostridiaceae bacterium]
MKSFSIAVVKIKKILFSSSILITMFVIPLFFIYAVGSIYAPATIQRGIPIAIVDEDNSEYSRFLISLLREEEVLSLQIMEEQEAIQLVRDNKVEGAYIIKKDFQDLIKSDNTPRVEVIKSTVAHGAEAIIEIIASGVVRLQSNARAANIVVQEYHQRGLVEDRDILWQEVFEKSESYWYPQQLMQLDYASVHYGTDSREERNIVGFSEGPIGLILTFLPLFLGFGLTSILKEKQEGVLKRLLVICGSPKSIILGNFFAMVILTGIQTIILFGGKHLFFNTSTPMPMGYSSIILITYIALFSAIILYVSSFIKREEGIQGMYSTAIIITSMIGGCFWALDLLPKPLRALALLTPQGLAITAFNAGNIGDFLSMGIYAMVMMIIAILILLLTYKRFNYSLN